MDIRSEPVKIRTLLNNFQKTIAQSNNTPIITILQNFLLQLKTTFPTCMINVNIYGNNIISIQGNLLLTNGYTKKIFEETILSQTLKIDSLKEFCDKENIKFNDHNIRLKAKL